MLSDLSDLRLFERILATGSLSAAAREAGLSLAVVSKRLARLEERTGVCLLQRTTRRLAPTDEGRRFHEHCRRILAEIDEAEAWLQQRGQRVEGLLRISAPFGFGRRHLVPLIATFRNRYPDLRVRLELDDNLVDLVQEGVDLAIRYSQPQDSSLIGRELAPNHRLLCAAPDYLDWHGRPQHPEDLQQHACILIGQREQAEWPFPHSGLRLNIQGALLCNDGETAHALALQGAGIVLKSLWDVAADLKAGRLQQVLPNHPSPLPRCTPSIPTPVTWRRGCGASSTSSPNVWSAPGGRKSPRGDARMSEASPLCVATQRGNNFD
ncbi:LysR family transcriptional regulator [Azotobacter sp. CWF10]